MWAPEVVITNRQTRARVHQQFVRTNFVFLQ